MLLGVASESDDHGLRLHLDVKVLPDEVGGLEAIHDGHTAVHQDEPIGVVALLLGLLDLLNRVFSISGFVHQVVNQSGVSNGCLEHYFEAKEVVGLVINN